jgi:thiamine-monophosphate kinase
MKMSDDQTKNFKNPGSGEEPMKKKTLLRVPGRSMGNLGEFGLIRILRSRLKAHNPEVIEGIGNDAAVLRPKVGWDLVFTTDMLVEGRHFDRKTTDPFSLGAKSIAVNLSDCAAMGAKPLAAVISLGLPKSIPSSWVTALYEGMEGWADSFGLDLVGGDTVGSRDITLNVALLGEVEKGKALTRCGAKAGDVLMVTGSLGDSAAGLHSLQHPSKKGVEVRVLLERKHKTPVPRCVVGRFLVDTGVVTSCIDVSDGLSSEVNHLAEESGLGAEVHANALPISDALDFYCSEWDLDPMVFALHGGEDYELLFTVPAKKVAMVMERLGAETGASVRPIGCMTAQKKGVRWFGPRGKASVLKPKGYDHFS